MEEKRVQKQIRIVCQSYLIYHFPWRTENQAVFGGLQSAKPSSAWRDRQELETGVLRPVAHFAWNT